MKKNYRALSAGVLAVGVVLAGCTPPGSGDSDGAAGGAESSVLNIGWNESFRSMNPLTSNGNAVANRIVTYMVNGNFGYYDDNLEIQDGNLGTIEQVSDDPLKVRYTFADDANWSDGAPVDAADLTLTWAALSAHFNTEEADDVERDDDGDVKELEDASVYFDASSIAAELIEDFPEISEDGKEVTFTYSEPYADWLYAMGFGGRGVGLPAHIVAKKALGDGGSGCSEAGGA